jgi:hypothetical protein
MATASAQFDLGSHCGSCGIHGGISIQEVRGEVLIDIREYKIGGDDEHLYLSPSGKGVAFSIPQWIELKRLLSYMDAAVKVASENTGQNFDLDLKKDRAGGITTQVYDLRQEKQRRSSLREKSRELRPHHF